MLGEEEEDNAKHLIYQVGSAVGLSGTLCPFRLGAVRAMEARLVKGAKWMPLKPPTSVAALSR